MLSHAVEIRILEFTIVLSTLVRSPNARIIGTKCVPVPPHLQVLSTLRYMATSNHQLTISDCYNVSQCYASRCSSRVTRVISRMSHNIVKMPGANETLRVMGDFMAIAGMPAVVGCIDCTHTTIKKPPGDRSENFSNTKGVFS
ncbi:putative nuclease HARBI1 [Penaeus chinensis]|uniref:putative nuclease HARBI1 n=1 Tax=Penaeus chinensis TaxID=139456 RepID=UPI001FB5FA9C|nr:putative nuclease HARBI1 [Penaeus chinensis]